MRSAGELGFSVVDVESPASEASQAQDVAASLVEADAEALPATLCSIEIEVDGVRPTAVSDMQALRAACELMRLSIRGRKVECFERWGKHIAEQQVIMHNEGKLSTVLHHSTLHSAQLRGPATSRFPTTSRQLELNENCGSQNRRELKSFRNLRSRELE